MFVCANDKKNKCAGEKKKQHNKGLMDLYWRTALENNKGRADGAVIWTNVYYSDDCSDSVTHK